MTAENDCRIPEGVLHAIEVQRRYIEAHNKAMASPKPESDPECPECHGVGRKPLFSSNDPCPRCSP